jgi:predicted nuclease of predicted toxin-antitoxin system
MKILADENIDYPIVEALRRLGFQVGTILEQQRGISDEIVLKKSVTEKSILLTEDKDFGEHVFRMGSEFSGVILTRLPWNGVAERVRAIAACLELHSENLEDSFTVISPGRVRIRRR